ncbi:response regulator transcription factor [Micromonospora sp. DR5-3]|uniref:response regulator transcription factor n=1 Tax=unclassified Micromonospora TaxID=2617518 RepID=UPI0011DA33B5|nr:MULTISPECIES: response regulator transcription factor [unclassified Micromonospora]MCW3820556.1 response regulator transcription factor [Micromonospora sp. DR5-3]TYC20715.1 response regulator transcription factor [Micromonospora sp. MP36]
MIRVLLAEDVRVLREALAELLGHEDDIEVVAAVDRGDAVVPAAVRHRPDVAVIDIEMPGIDGLDAAARLRRELPTCRTLVLTGIGGPATLRRGVQAQVAGFMLKDSGPREVADAIRTVAAGGRVLDPQLAYVALGSTDSPLTERETEVLRLTASGATPREVAASLYLTYGTVRNYLASAVTKLDARNRVDAIRIAAEAGWL